MAKRENSKRIQFIGRSDESEDRGLSDYFSAKALRVATIDAAKLRNQLSAFLENMDEVMAGLSRTVLSLELDSVTVSAELSASGEVRLVGVGGAEVSGKGGLSFTLKKRAAGGQ